MTLAEYILSTGSNATAFAERAGCAVSTITRILGGERLPSLELALRIERLTDGQVKPANFVIEPTRSPESAA